MGYGEMSIAAVHIAPMPRKPRTSVDMLPPAARRLREARAKRGFATAMDAARFFGWNYSTYHLHELGTRGIKPAVASIYAKALRTTASWILTGEGTGDLVPVVGLAGAGPDGAVLFSLGDGNLGDAPSPPIRSRATVAVEVRGNSMRGIAEDGWFVYYDDRHEPPTAQMIGRLCVVGLADSRVLVKFLHRGSRPETFNLESVGAPTLRDVAVEWAAEVTSIVPSYRK